MANTDRESEFIKKLTEIYQSDGIYCLIGKILVAINPYKEIKGMYSDEEKRKYRTEEFIKLQPHLYLIGKFSFNGD